MDTASERRLLSARWLAAPAVAGVAWAATSLRPFTHPALVATLLSGLAVVVLGSRARQKQPLKPARRLVGERGLSLWVLLIAALALWELLAFVQLPRADHPTVSSLANQVFDSHLARAGAFAVWLAAGFGIARR